MESSGAGFSTATSNLSHALAGGGGLLECRFAGMACETKPLLVDGFCLLGHCHPTPSLIKLLATVPRSGQACLKLWLVAHDSPNTLQGNFALVPP